MILTKTELKTKSNKRKTDFIDLTKPIEIFDLTVENDDFEKLEDDYFISNSQDKSLVISELCSICYCDLSYDIGLLKCDHYFCYDCIIKWTKLSKLNARNKVRTCPLCRKVYTEGSILKVTYNQLK